jgi:hypothetical protein
MTPFQRHGVQHLSASQITLWSSAPDKWLATKLLGYKGPTSAAMERGKAVEAGLTALLHGSPMEEAVKLATAEYQMGMRFMPSNGDYTSELANIAPMLKRSAIAIGQFGEPEWPASGGRQHKIEMDLHYGDDEDEFIPVIGYLDFVFGEAVVDLKTTTQCKSVMPWAHRVQSCIYQRSTNKPVNFVYATASKSNILRDDNHHELVPQIRAIVRRLADFLGISDDPEVLRKIVPVIADSYAWRGEEDARRRLYGI